MASINGLVTRIARRTRRSATTGSNFHGEIIDELVAAQNKLEEGATLPWFLQVEEEEAQTANAETIDTVAELANVFIRFLDDDPLLYLDPAAASGAELVEIVQNSEFRIMKQRFPRTGLIPKEFVLIGKDIFLRPIPTQALTYTVRFFRKDPTVPAEDATTLWSKNYSDLLMNMAGKEIAWTLRDFDVESKFEKDLAIAYSQYIKSVTARENAGQVHVMGDP